ncbi:MAG TPA: endonuclease/exonuclease/phosphatase family protein [Gemmatimonadales bacterium]|jgi:endonuclease/exonuclease/phosphatase family metal-dependent hydrolase|nr:endonuclease/exonuclease/phosphatase family protein [Gemmatimonadales bacterium]
MRLKSGVTTTKRLSIVAAGLLLAGCAHTVNLLNPLSPKFEGSYAPAVAAAEGGTRLRVVSFNIKLADQIDQAIAVLRTPELANADVISLQEMDESGTEHIARALHLNYVYYPGSIHPTRERYFGPAILTRWPIVETGKVILPYEAPVRHQRRTATAATIDVRGTCLRVYAVHLETQIRATERDRESQVDAILADAAGTKCPVVVAGDFNSKGIGSYFEQKGFTWPTRDVGRTITWFSWDHIFARGFGLPDSARAGKVSEVHGASDHRPVWASLVLSRELGARSQGAALP